MEGNNKTFADRQRENKSPLPFAIYKGMGGKYGALRIGLKPAYSGDQNRGKNEGCVFIESCPTISKNVYGWEEGKIAMALGPVDLGKIISFLRNPRAAKDGKVEIYHDKYAGTPDAGKYPSVLSISKPPEMENFFFTMTKKEKDKDDKRTNLPVSEAEALVLSSLFVAAFSRILSW